jgi:hypothetical protein
MVRTGRAFHASAAAPHAAGAGHPLLAAGAAPLALSCLIVNTQTLHIHMPPNPRPFRPQHKVACWPEKLRMHVPAEREVIHSIKRAGVSRLVETMADQLSLAGAGALVGGGVAKGGNQAGRRLPRGCPDPHIDWWQQQNWRTAHAPTSGAVPAGPPPALTLDTHPIHPPSPTHQPTHHPPTQLWHGRRGWGVGGWLWQ